MGVGDGVGGNLMALGVQVLHLAIVSPLVGDVESCCRVTAIRVGTTLEQSGVEVVVEVIDCIVKCEKNKLWSLVRRDTSRDGQATGAGGQLAGGGTGVHY